MRARRGRVALFAGFGVVGECEAGADEEDVARADVAALGRGADVEVLGLAAGEEGGEWDA